MTIASNNLPHRNARPQAARHDPRMDRPQTSVLRTTTISGPAFLKGVGCRRPAGNPGHGGRRQTTPPFQAQNQAGRRHSTSPTKSRGTARAQQAFGQTPSPWTGRNNYSGPRPRSPPAGTLADRPAGKPERAKLGTADPRPNSGSLVFNRSERRLKPVDQLHLGAPGAVSKYGRRGTTKLYRKTHLLRAPTNVSSPAPCRSGDGGNAAGWALGNR